MGGGLLQLVAYGAQDVYLTGNPQITFFKVVYRRHTNFAIEAIVQTPTGGNTFGSRASFQITRNGDLIHRVYFYCKIKADLANNSVALVPNFGQKLLKTVELEIGGQRIDKHYSEWLYIWNELSLPVGKREGYNTMVGANPRNICTKLTSGNSYELYVPLEFWFCRNVGLALPLIALQYHEVKINIEYESESNMKDYTGTNFTYEEELSAGSVSSVSLSGGNTGYVSTLPTITFSAAPTGGTTAMGYAVIASGSITIIMTNSGSGYTSAPTCTVGPVSGATVPTTVTPNLATTNSNSTTAKFPVAASGQISLTSPTLWVDYIFLDTDERRRFAQLSHEYLIEQLQFTGTETITMGESMKSIRMNFNHPCKELIWTVKNSETGIYWNNFSSGSRSVASATAFINDALDSTNPITNCKIMLNGNDRMAPRTGEYFGIVQPYQHHEITPDKFHEGINVYSFAIKPEEHQPSGTLNMSRIDTATLSVASSITGNISVYAVNYNVLRILSGMGGLAYSN